MIHFPFCSCHMSDIIVKKEAGYMKLCIALTGIVPKQSLMDQEDYNDYSRQQQDLSQNGRYADCIFEECN